MGFEGVVEFPDVPCVMLAMVYAHGFLVDHGFERVISKPQFGKVNPDAVVSEPLMLGPGALPQPRREETRGVANKPAPARPPTLRKVRLSMVMALMATNWVALVIIKPLLFTLVQRWPVDRESGT